MSRVELILYATPTGPLATALDRMFAQLAAHHPTTAQTYPPHCTLTGFFRRPPDAIPRLGRELAAALSEAGPRTDDAIEVTALHHGPDWTGLEIHSPWLHRVVDRFVAHHQLEPGDDALRAKDWLHLSLAYGTGDVEAAGEVARDLDWRSPAGWEIALWRRDDGVWEQLRDS